MTKRIFRTVFTVAISMFLVSAAIFMTVLYDYFFSVQLEQLRMQTDLASQGVQNGGMEYLEGLKLSDLRITWIGTDGTVLYDNMSNPDEMENHFQRAEVKEALAEGYGESDRYSETLTQRYLYSAKRLPDGTVMRLSVAQHSLLVLTLGMIQPILILFVAAVALSAVLASRLSKKIVNPLNELNLEEPLENDGYDELSPLLRRIDTQQREIRKQEEELRQKKNEFGVLTSSMTEGIVLLNVRGIILSINQAAAKLFETDLYCTGKDILSVNRTLELTALLERAKQGERAEILMGFGESRYQVEASPVSAGGAVSGIVLLLLDVTEKEKAGQMRREFTANVSHELKTPLHAISGSAELLAGGMVRAEDVPVFSERIYTEAQRMIRLVEDIIHLSHLDEGTDDMKREDVDLYALAKETLDSLAEEAEAAGVALELCGEAASVHGIRQLLQGILYNLCDNAVKYNRKGGSVTVTVGQESGNVLLSVADTGIGIPKEHHGRIFERFYRVDKSHSKETGGTGLGLSIVKHSARLHGAAVEVASTAGEGTTMTVRFPQK